MRHLHHGNLALSTCNFNINWRLNYLRTANVCTNRLINAHYHASVIRLRYNGAVAIHRLNGWLNIRYRCVTPTGTDSTRRTSHNVMLSGSSGSRSGSRISGQRSQYIVIVSSCSKCARPPACTAALAQSLIQHAYLIRRPGRSASSWSLLLLLLLLADYSDPSTGCNDRRGQQPHAAVDWLTDCKSVNENARPLRGSGWRTAVESCSSR